LYSIRDTVRIEAPWKNREKFSQEGQNQRFTVKTLRVTLALAYNIGAANVSSRSERQTRGVVEGREVLNQSHETVKREDSRRRTGFI